MSWANVILGLHLRLVIGNLIRNKSCVNATDNIYVDIFQNFCEFVTNFLWIQAALQFPLCVKKSMFTLTVKLMEVPQLNFVSGGPFLWTLALMVPCFRYICPSHDTLL